jgi:hypothetical protein
MVADCANCQFPLRLIGYILRTVYRSCFISPHCAALGTVSAIIQVVQFQQQDFLHL